MPSQEKSKATFIKTVIDFSLFLMYFFNGEYTESIGM